MRCEWCHIKPAMEGEVLCPLHVVKFARAADMLVLLLKREAQLRAALAKGGSACECP